MKQSIIKKYNFLRSKLKAQVIFHRLHNQEYECWYNVLKANYDVTDLPNHTIYKCSRHGYSKPLHQLLYKVVGVLSHYELDYGAFQIGYINAQESSQEQKYRVAT